MSQLELTISQTETAQRILQTLAQASEPTLIIVEGISGVGKSAVLDSVKREIKSAKGRILESYELQHYWLDSDAISLLKSSKHLIKTCTPYESESLLKKLEEHRGHRQISTIILPGMDLGEIGVYLEPRANQAQMDINELANHSLGVPLLADMLLMNSRDPKDAAIIAGNHLSCNFGPELTGKIGANMAYLANYLKIPPTKDVLQAATNGNSFGGVYHSLDQILARQLELRQRGMNEESPLFTAPESVKIYDSKLGRYDGSNIHIFAPIQNADDLTRVQEAFELYRQNGRERRFRMFGAMWRKTGMALTEGDSVHSNESECQDIEKTSQKYESAYNGGQLPLKTEDSSVGSLFVESWDHEGQGSHPKRIAWMVESLLQQRGISYLVNIPHINVAYKFDAKTNSVTILEKPIKL
ncbi:MAG: hypothetical protein AABX00_01650 [Nanoarchaeota archaeon]